MTKHEKVHVQNTILHKQRKTNEISTSEIRAYIISEDIINPETMDHAAEDATTDKMKLNQTNNVKSAIESCASGNNLLFSFLSQSHFYLPTDCEK